MLCASGADDGEPTRTPPAWMISPPPSTPDKNQHACDVDDGPPISVLFPVPFPEWVTSAKRYWVTFA